jgi:hypothetical protein
MVLKSGILRGIALVAVAAALGWGGASQASVITYNFIATVDDVPPGFGGEFANGQIVTGGFTYDSTTAALGGSTSNQSVFNALSNFHFSINSTSSYAASSANSAEIQIDNDLALDPDRFGVLSRVSQGLAGTTPNVDGLALAAAGVILRDSTKTVFSDALVLPTVLDLADFDSAVFLLLFDLPPDSTELPRGAVLGATITALVPEPATMLVFGLGLAGLGFMRRRLAA